MAQQANTTSAPPSDSPNTNTGVQGSQNQTVDLLNASTYTWKPVNYAKVFQSEDQLIIVADTHSADKIYNRAYLQTQLNTTKHPLELHLDYSFESLNEENATLALEVRNPGNNTILSSWGLNEEPVNTRFPLPDNITNTPIELRLYVITDQPGFYILTVSEVSVQ
jgi:hypothetical protein